MLEPIYITGHKNPDTDSICAAIAYAELKQMLGQNAIACRIGDINPETEFVLNKFQVEAPLLLQSAKSQICDIDIDEAIMIQPHKNLENAWNSVADTTNKSVVVVDEEEKLLGVASLSALSNVMMWDSTQIQTLMTQATIQSLAEVTEAKILVESGSFAPDGRVMIPVTKQELENEDFTNAIVLVGDDVTTQEKMIQDHCACMVIVNNHYISDEMIELAKNENVSIIKTSLHLIQVARKIYLAPPVELVMKRDVETVRTDEYIDEAAKRVLKTRFRSYPVVDDENKVMGAVSRYHLLKYRKKKFVLVDHNEKSQTIDDVEQGEIVEIIDHHRIGNIETNQPIIFRNQNIGSTCSIIYQIYKENGIVPSKKIASLLLAAIVSDTMNFNSPTTTPIDKVLGKELAEIAGLNIDEFAVEMFSAAATIKNRTCSEILYNDFKEFAIEGYRVGVGQVNIMNPDELDEIREEFKEYMEQINSVNKYDLLLMTFTNVILQGSYFMASGKLADIPNEAFGEGALTNFMPGYVSRKKQIIPSLAEALKN
ncbi:MAG: putative manganese-dependent inorganic diphosphatase [Erysipelotrichales bacterium]|nr:putative manganese-dependent inorganic diphosphatase [Erysipelotrichales bacterium]